MVAIASFFCGILLGIGYGWLFGLRMRSYVINNEKKHQSKSRRFWLFISFIISYCLLFGTIWALLVYANMSLSFCLAGFGIGFGSMVWLFVRGLR